MCRGNPVLALASAGMLLPYVASLLTLLFVPFFDTNPRIAILTTVLLAAAVPLGQLLSLLGFREIGKSVKPLAGGATIAILLVASSFLVNAYPDAGTIPTTLWLLAYLLLGCSLFFLRNPISFLAGISTIATAGLLLLTEETTIAAAAGIIALLCQFWILQKAYWKSRPAARN